ncbi:MAG: bis(5'-nucleosyl)-tetraphosphatase (symmetrical) YqeK [Caldanaerobacter sp.]
MKYDIERMKAKLKEILDKERYSHSIGVMETALKLAEKYGADVEKAMVAGLLHDCAKGLSDEELLKMAYKYGVPVDNILLKVPFLLHGPVGACMVQELFGVTDEEIKRAIALHTTGDVNMSILDKIIFLADYIEPNRDFEGVEELRELSWKDLDLAVLRAYDSTICYVIKRNMILYEKTVSGRNDILLKLGEEKHEKIS